MPLVTCPSYHTLNLSFNLFDIPSLTYFLLCISHIKTLSWFQDDRVGRPVLPPTFLSLLACLFSWDALNYARASVLRFPCISILWCAIVMPPFCSLRLLVHMHILLEYVMFWIDLAWCRDFSSNIVAFVVSCQAHLPTNLYLPLSTISLRRFWGYFEWCPSP